MTVDEELVTYRSLGLVPVTDPSELEALSGRGLSVWFDPFLARFGRDALLCGGEVWVLRDGADTSTAVFVDRTEGVASVFGRDRRLVEQLVRERRGTAVYTEFDLGPPSEPFDIFVAPLGPGAPSHRFRHPIRIVPPDGMSEVIALMKEVYGRLDDRWFGLARGVGETCFRADVGDTLAGVAFASATGDRARLHSLTVRPGFRGLGVGTDLLFARLLWARQQGLREAFSEISENNRASRAVAAHAGMLPVGRIYLHPRR
jgi:GNAT superfamily N-acetyltransferase